ncbi:MAG: class I SAM-dependent methyltransferase [Steroidobacteraceae bacterium]
MNATQKQLADSVERTPARVLERYQENRGWRIYEKEYIYRNFPPVGLTWLDFGCGTGEITTQLALLGARRVVGVDITPELLDAAEERARLDGVSDRISIRYGDICGLDPEPVDVILAHKVLHHLPDRLAEAMIALRHWLKPGGTFICVEPVSYLPWLKWIRQHCGVPYRPLDPGERQLTESDLRIIEGPFEYCRRVHFHAWTRLTRLCPVADAMFRHTDRLFLALPGLKQLAGTVILTCRTVVGDEPRRRNSAHAGPPHFPSTENASSTFPGIPALVEYPESTKIMPSPATGPAKLNEPPLARTPLNQKREAVAKLVQP